MTTTALAHARGVINLHNMCSLVSLYSTCSDDYTNRETENAVLALK